MAEDEKTEETKTTETERVSEKNPDPGFAGNRERTVEGERETTHVTRETSSGDDK